MTQYLIMGAIVLWAVLYSAWALMPAASRRAAAARVSGWASRFGLGKRAAQGLQARLAQAGGCGSCSGCSGCGKPGAEGGREIHVVRNASPH